MSTSIEQSVLSATRRSVPENGRGGLLRVLRPEVLLRSGLLPLLLLAAIVIFAIAEPRFLSSANAINIMRQASFLLIIAMGQMVALLSAEIDMSVGANVALTSVISATVMTNVGTGGAISVLAGIAAGLTVGLVLGALNGVLVARFRVPSFIITIATQSMAFGTALVISRGAPVTGLPRSFVQIFAGNWFGIPAPVIIAAALVAVMYLILEWTVFGRFLYAVGGSEKAARLGGVPVFWIKLSAMLLCAVLTAIAGLLLTARVTSGEANLGSEYVILSIAAAVLGGTSFFGGEGRLGLVVVGSIFLVILTNGMNLMRIESYLQLIVLGALLGLAVVMDRIRTTGT